MPTLRVAAAVAWLALGAGSAGADDPPRTGAVEGARRAQPSARPEAAGPAPRAAPGEGPGPAAALPLPGRASRNAELGRRGRAAHRAAPSPQPGAGRAPGRGP